MDYFLLKGRDTHYPNDEDFDNIRPFEELFLRKVPGLRSKDLEPTKDDYEDALRRNAELLEKYGGPILNGEEWLPGKGRWMKFRWKVLSTIYYKFFH